MGTYSRSHRQASVKSAPAHQPRSAIPSIQTRPFSPQPSSDAPRSETDLQAQLDHARKLDVSRFGQAFTQPSSCIQAKPTIASANDKHEQEADQVASHIAQHIHSSQKPAPVVQQLSPVPTPQIQRFVMSNRQWQNISKSTGTSVRSQELIDIDEALWIYNKKETQLGSPAVRSDVLNVLLEAITAWKDSKTGKSQGKHRYDAITALEKRVVKEMNTVGVLTRAPDTVGESILQARRIRQDLYQRMREATQDILGLKKGTHSQLHKLNIWPKLRQESTDLTKSFFQYCKTKRQQKPRPAAVELAQDESALAQLVAITHAVDGYRAITHAYLNVPLPNGGHSLMTVLTYLQHTTAKHRVYIRDAEDLVHTIVQDLQAYQAIANQDADSEGSSFLDDDQGDLADETLGSIDSATGFAGYFGTGGTGNEGFAEFFKPTPGSGESDQRTEAQKLIGDAFSKGLQSDGTTGPGTGDLLSGYTDAPGAMAGSISEAFAMGRAIKVLKDEDATAGDKAEARTRLVASGFAQLAVAGKFGGGIATLVRGHLKLASGDADASHILKGIEAGSWKSAAGTDVSTDIKIMGDGASVISNSVGFVADVINFFKSIAQRGEKYKTGGHRRQFQFFMLKVKQFIGLLSSLAKNHSAVTKLAFQIKGGGQVAASEAGMASQIAQGSVGQLNIVPALGLVMSILDVIQNVGRLARIGDRHAILIDQIKELIVDQSKSASLSTLNALEVALSGLDKRFNRIMINIGHAMMGVVSGGLNTSGVGAAPGMIISIASTALRLGQIGLRLAKQKSRDVKADNRAAKGKTKTYQEWVFEKRKAAAAKGKGHQILTEVKVKFQINWDKSSRQKQANYREAALEILHLGNENVYKALGIKHDLAKEPNQGKRLDIVIGALSKRD